MAKKASKTNSPKTTAPKTTTPEVGTPTKFVVTGAPIKTKAAQDRDKNKGKEPWRHKATTGKAHPDNNPPVQIVAQASDENIKKYEDSINAEREKALPKVDWRDLEGGVPAEEPAEPSNVRYGPADADPRLKAEVKQDAQAESKDKAKK